MFSSRWRQTLVSASVTLASVAGVAGSISSTANEPELPGRADAVTDLPVDGGTPKELPLPPPVPAEEPPAEPAVRTASSYEIDGPTDIPASVLAAYRSAEAATARSDAGCHLDWTLLAAIGRIESGHARGGAVDAKGTTTSPILGPVLAGGPDIAAIRDTDGGRHDGNSTWDRAVGPMQFIPSTWAVWGRDGNGDGSADPHNVHDAALAAAGYLCVGERDLADSGQLRRAVFGYNHSWDYVATVLAWMRAYAEGGSLAPVTLGGPGGSGGGLGSGDDGTSVAVLSATKKVAAVTTARAASPSGTTSGSATAPPSATPRPSATPPSDPTPPSSPPTTPAETTPPPSQPPASDPPPPDPTPSPSCSPTPTPSETPTPTPSPTPSEDPCATQSAEPAPTTTPSP